MGSEDVASIGDRWKGWGTIAGAHHRACCFLLGGSSSIMRFGEASHLRIQYCQPIMSEVRPLLGYVIENRGRVPLTDVDVILADLAVPIEMMNMPGAHEPARVVRGDGEKNVQIRVPRFSSGTSLSIYLLTSAPIVLLEPKTLL